MKEGKKITLALTNREKIALSDWLRANKEVVENSDREKIAALYFKEVGKQISKSTVSLFTKDLEIKIKRKKKNHKIPCGVDNNGKSLHRMDLMKEEIIKKINDVYALVDKRIGLLEDLIK